jgi:hypothetical protein
MPKQVINLTKSTANDKRRMLSDALDSGWVIDNDDEFIYFEQWDNVDERYVAFRRTYNISEGNVVTFGEEKEQIVLTTTAEVVDSGDTVTEKSIASYVSKALDKYFGGSKKNNMNVIKQFGDTDEMFCIEPLYTAPNKADGDGEMMSAETIDGMVTSLNKANDDGRLQSGLFHKQLTKSWHLDKAWVNPTACIIGETLVPEGQPIARTIFTNEAAFELRKSGEIAGLSIGARATNIVDISKSAEELAALQAEPEAQREIIGTHFDWEHPELTYTSKAQGGASHMQNNTLNLAKAKKATKEDLLVEEISILKEIDEEFVSLKKHLSGGNNQTPSSSAEAKVGEETKVDKGNKETMSKDIVTRKEFEDLQKALKESKAENSLMSYGFEVELNKKLAVAVAELESADVITQAFDALIARGELAVTKAKESPTEETDLQKALAGEAGEAGEPEAEVEKSFIDKITAHQDKESK